MKSPHERKIVSIVEILCSLGILYGLKDIAIKVVEEPVLIAIGSGIILGMVILAVFVKWKQEKFWLAYRKSKRLVLHSLTAGTTMISNSEPFSEEPKMEDFSEIQPTFDRFFILVIATLLLLAVFFALSRGGVN